MAETIQAAGIYLAFVLGSRTIELSNSRQTPSVSLINPFILVRNLYRLHDSGRYLRLEIKFRQINLVRRSHKRSFYLAPGHTVEAFLIR